MGWTTAASQPTYDALRRYSKFGWLLFPSEYPEMPKVWGGVPTKQSHQQQASLHPGVPPSGPLAAGLEQQATQQIAVAAQQTAAAVEQPQQQQAAATQLPRKRQKTAQPSAQQPSRSPSRPQPHQPQKVAALLDQIYRQGLDAVQLAAPADLVAPGNSSPAIGDQGAQSDVATAQDSAAVAAHADEVAKAAAMQPPAASAAVKLPAAAARSVTASQRPTIAAKKPVAAARKPPKPPAQPKRKAKQTQAQPSSSPAAAQLQAASEQVQVEVEDLDAPTPTCKPPARGKRAADQEAQEQLLQELDEQLPANSLNALEHDARVSKGGKEPAKKKRGVPQKWSNINLAQHIFYLTHAGREGQLSLEKQQELQDIAAKIRAEQEKFRAIRLAEGLQEAADSRRFDFIDPRASAQIEVCLAAKREGIRSHARNWQYERSIKLDAVALTAPNATSDLKHLHTVKPAADSAPAGGGEASEEAAVKFRLPEESTRISLDQAWLGDDASLARPPAPNAAAAAISASEGAHAFLAASALSALVKLLADAYEVGFEVPVRVAASPKRGMGSLVILEKPLLQRSFTLRQKHELLYKQALMLIGNGKAAEGEAEDDRAFEEDLDAQLFGSDEKEDKAAAGSCAPAPASEYVKRNVRHDVWQLGGLRVVTCAHALPQSPPTPEEATGACSDKDEASVPGDADASRGLVVRAKMEYQGAEEKDAEEVTREEQAAWWLALKLRPGCSLTVGHVAVKESRLVRTRSYAEGDIHASAQANFFGNLLAKLLGMLRNQPHGQYLLTHVPGSDVIDCLKALPGNDRKAGAVPLPSSRLMAGQTYDLWAAHAASGATDTSKVPFVPRQWKPADASLRQVPDTFPVRSSKSRRAPEGEEAGGEVAVKRRRKRRLGPSAWAQDKDDWDAAPAPVDAAALQAYQEQLDL